MHTRGRALYNLLRMNWLENDQIQVQPWQVEDYREKSDEALFQLLADLGARLDKATFLAYVDNTDSPEDMADCLWVKEENPETFDRIYLVIFELWRRFAPEKQTLSIFCDELDQLIGLYDHGELEEEKIQAALSELQRILEKKFSRSTTFSSI